MCLNPNYCAKRATKFLHSITHLTANRCQVSGLCSRHEANHLRQWHHRSGVHSCLFCEEPDSGSTSIRLSESCWVFPPLHFCWRWGVTGEMGEASGDSQLQGDTFSHQTAVFKHKHGRVQTFDCLNKYPSILLLKVNPKKYIYLYVNVFINMHMFHQHHQSCVGGWTDSCSLAAAADLQAVWDWRMESCDMLVWLSLAAAVTAGVLKG